MINEKVSVTGELHIILRDLNGNLITDVTVPNLVVGGGKNIIASRLGNGTLTAVYKMSVGTSATTVTTGDIALAAWLADSTLTSTSVSTNTVTYTATFGAGVSGTIQEAGLFNSDSPTAVMLARTTFAVISKSSSDTLTINWAITIN